MDGYLRAEISVSALRHNLRLLRSRLRPGTGLCAVVKADAYGHGVRGVVDAVGEAADMLAVATAAEAMELRDLGWRQRLLVLATAGASTSADLAMLVAREVTLTLSGRDELALLHEAARGAGRAADVHLKIDTGMGRNGVPADAAALLTAAARQSPSVSLGGLFTHFACADEGDEGPTREQLRRFVGAVEACGGGAGLLVHCANSAATLRLPQTHLSMVRPGLALYGYHGGPAGAPRVPLRPALRLVGRVALVKDLPAGAAVGYGLTHRFDRAARVALVPVGYADGYLRCWSNVASMRVGGVDCPVRGRVSMDQTILDVTAVPGIRVGDEVEILSDDPAAPHSVETLARLAQTIPYEVVCRLGTRVRRVMVG